MRQLKGQISIEEYLNPHPSFDYSLLRGAKGIMEDIQPYCDIYMIKFKQPFHGLNETRAIWLGCYWHTLNGWDFHQKGGEYPERIWIESWEKIEDRKRTKEQK